jgi:hypothetical protein
MARTGEMWKPDLKTIRNDKESTILLHFLWEPLKRPKAGDMWVIHLRGV